MVKPLVSIIVPVYNTEKYLRKCLDSLINQTLADIEIIIVNDGSTDGSQLIIDEYALKYTDKVIGHSKPNSGLSDARNYGIERALGEYIGFVDSDDWVSVEMYQHLYEKAVQDNLDIACSGFLSVYETQQIMIPAMREAKIGKYGLDVVMWNKIYRRDFLNQNRLRHYSGIKLEDKELFIRMLSLTDKVGYLDENLYYYNRTNLNSIMSISSRFPIDQRKIIMSLAKWQETHGVTDYGYEYKLMYEVCLYLWHHEIDAREGVDIFNRFKWRILFNCKLRYTFKLKAILMIISPKLINLLLNK